MIKSERLFWGLPEIYRDTRSGAGRGARALGFHRSLRLPALVEYHRRGTRGTRHLATAVKPSVASGAFIFVVYSVWVLIWV